MEKYFALIENEKIIKLGEFNSLEEASETEHEPEVILTVRTDTMLDWKKEIEEINLTNRNEDTFVFVVNHNLEFAIYDATPNPDSLDEALEDSNSGYWVMRGQDVLDGLYKNIVELLEED